MDESEYLTLVGKVKAGRASPDEIAALDVEARARVAATYAEIGAEQEA